MFLLKTLRVISAFMALLVEQAKTSTPAFWPGDFATWVDVISKLLGVLGLLVGGIWVLKTYAEAQRLKASEILLKMEEEFRCIFRIYTKLEDILDYQREIKPVLERVMFREKKFETKLKQTPEFSVMTQRRKKQAIEVVKLLGTLNQKEMDLLCDLDRCLRFFYLCSVLNRDLKVEQDALKRSYYYYVGLLAEDEERPELADYVSMYYPRLDRWIEANRSDLEGFRRGIG